MVGSTTYIWTPDAVEAKDLKYHDTRSKCIQGEDDEGPEPSLAKDILDCVMISGLAV
jgi:hypothetical protein